MITFDPKACIPPVPEEKLIAYVRIPLKEMGFKKKNKRWVKTDEEFTQIFLIQGSCFDKDDYYVRPGIFLNHVDRGYEYYGHIMCEIKVVSAEQVLQEAAAFFREYTDKQLLKQRVRAFAEWDRRNPPEKRRVDEVDYIKDPVPDEHFWSMSKEAIAYVLNTF